MALIVILGLLYLGPCFLVGYVAQEKHRSGPSWFGFSLLYSPLIAILFLIALPVAKPQVNVQQYGAAAVAAELGVGLEQRKPWPLSLIAIAVIAVTILGLALISGARAESTMQRDQPTTVFRDSRGTVTGRASTDSQGTTTFYDARGNHVGSASRRR